MKLAEAIKKVITDFGLSIMKDENILNFLQDYSAFDDWKASKHVMSILIQSSFISKLLVFIKNGQKPSSLMKQLKEDLNNTYGIKDKLIEYIYNNIISGFSLDIETITVSSNENEDIKCQVESVKSDDQVSAQDDDDNHLKFKDIAIHGDINIIVRKLESQGFHTTEKSTDGVLLKGTYAGIEDCTLFIAISSFINEVASIFVQFPSCTSWWSLKAEYLKFKEKLSKKYGEPESYEFFHYPYEEGDGYELSAVSSNKCSYLSKFKVNFGEIGLFISSDQRIALSFDDADCARRIEEKKNQLSDIDL